VVVTDEILVKKLDGHYSQLPRGQIDDYLGNPGQTNAESPFPEHELNVTET
jgi:hypothetical protein